MPTNPTINNSILSIENITNRITIEVAKPFQSILNFHHHFVMLSGGRVSGKTTITAQLLVAFTLMYPEHDIIIGRDSYSSLNTSTYAELIDYISSIGLDDSFITRTNPLKIRNIKSRCNIYFIGVGGSDKSRTRSYHTEHPLSALLIEEAQQIKDEESLNQAVASFRRLFDVAIVIVFYIFNPPAANSHWINIMFEMKKNDPDYLCIHSTYLDIIKFINDIDLKEILKVKLTDPMNYEWMYLGIPGGGYGMIYPQFKRKKHLRPYNEVIDQFSNSRDQPFTDEIKRLRFSQSIRALIIGGDGAVTHDSTSFIPMLLMDNGQAIIPEIFHHDPKLSGALASSQIVPLVKKWLSFIEHKYYIGANIPIVFYIDSAAADLTRELRYNLSPRYEVFPYNKQTIVEMVGTMQSTFAQNIVIIIDFPTYHDYAKGNEVKGQNPLVVALENLTWNEQKTGYDKSVPNDDSDALTYGVNSLFRNPNNLHAFNRYLETKKDFYDLD